MKFYKELSKSGVIFFWLFTGTFFARQLYLHAGVYVGSDQLIFNDGLRLIFGLANFIVMVAAVTYAWLYYTKMNERKMAIVKSMCYAALFYGVLVLSSALHPGLVPLENPQMSDDYFRLSILVFFGTLLDPIFKIYFKNVFVKIVAQIVAIQLVTTLMSFIFLFVVTSFLKIDSVEYNTTIKALLNVQWPSSFFILGVILVHFLGPLAAAGIVVINFALSILVIYFSATWSDFSFNSILAWLIFGAVFFKVELKSKWPTTI